MTRSDRRRRPRGRRQRRRLHGAVRAVDGASGRVFAFEPDPIAYDGLQEHIELNGIVDRVTAVAEAVSDGEAANCGSRWATRPASAASWSRRGQAASPPERATSAPCRSTVLRRISPHAQSSKSTSKVRSSRIARRALDDCRAGPDLQLFVEMHPQLWPGLGISAGDLRGECEAQGLVAEALDGSGEDIWTTEGVCLRLRPRRT